MLASTKRWVLLAGLALAACESDVQIEPCEGGGGEGAGNTTTSTSKAASVSSASTNVSSSASGAGGAPEDCENVPTYLQNLLEPAQACNPDELSLHCQFVIEGYCCPVVVENINSPATQAYLDFLELTKTQCPKMWQECNAVDCAQPSPGYCVETGVNMGQCNGYGPD